MSAAGPIAGLVLAAGASRRMGRPKALLPLEGTTYLGQVLATFGEAGLRPRAVVVGGSAAAIGPTLVAGEILRVDNPDWERGMLSSWNAGLAALATAAPELDAAVVALVDTPRFAAATVRALVAERRRSGQAVVVPRHRGRSGHPVLVGRELWTELATAPSPLGARAVLSAEPARRAEVEVDDPWILRDADTPAEHQRMLRGEP